MYFVYLGHHETCPPVGCSSIFVSISRNLRNINSSFFFFNRWGKGGGSFSNTACSGFAWLSLLFSIDFGFSSYEYLIDLFFFWCFYKFSLIPQSHCMTWEFFLVSLRRAPPGLQFWLAVIYPNFFGKFLIYMHNWWLSSSSFFIRSITLSSACYGGFCG